MQIVLRIVIAAGLAVFVVSWALFFFGRLQTQRVCAVGIGVALSAWALEMFGQALNSNWKLDWWRARWGKPTVHLGRLSSLGMSIFIGAVGLGFIGSVINREWLKEWGGWIVLVAGLTGFGLAWLGGSLDEQRAKRNKMKEDAPPADDAS